MMPKREIVPARETHAEPMAIPSDRLMEVSNERVRKDIEGLTAIGVPLGEAIASVSSRMGLSEAVKLAITLGGKNEFGLMRILHDLAEVTKDKKGFGLACLEHGYHPVGVAAALPVSSLFRDTANGSPTRTYREIVQNDIRAFDVDPWLADCLGLAGLVVNDPEVASRIESMGPARMVLPENVDLRLADDMVWPNLAMVGGGIEIESGVQIDFPVLTYATSIFSHARRLRAPVLREVCSMLIGVDRHDVDLSSLEWAAELHLMRTRGLAFPSLKKVSRDFDLNGTDYLLFPALESVGGPMNLTRARSISFSSLRRVAGPIFANESKGISFPVLEKGVSLLATGAVDLQIAETADIEDRPFPHRFPLAELFKGGASHEP